VRALARAAAKPRRTPYPLKPGVCFCCGCTDLYGCDGGCEWVDALQTLCSECQRIARAYLVRLGLVEGA
jgi:hypothetical protein